jgi:hypothetical protein
MEENSNNLPPKILCKVCLCPFNSEHGLLLHRRTVSKYNRPKEHVEILPPQTIKEFQEILVYHIHKKLGKNHTQAGRKTVSLPCTKSQFFSIFRGFIHYYQAKRGIYKCFFRGSWGKKELNYIFNDEQWSTKHYDQGQKTYIVLLDQPKDLLSNNKQFEVKKSEINPLALAFANKRIACKENIKKQGSRYKRGEVIIEWKEKKEREINNNFCYAGQITINFYISQIYLKS